jgi:hypothetical protein
VAETDSHAAVHDRDDEQVVGLEITGVFFLHDIIEVHMEDVILTGMTKPFGMIGCQGVGASSIVSLIGHEVEELTVADGEYVAIDSGESRLAFPIGGPTATGPESVMVVRADQPELASRRRHGSGSRAAARGVDGLSPHRDPVSSHADEPVS